MATLLTGFLGATVSHAAGANDQDEAAAPSALGRFNVRLKLPGTDTPIDAPSPATAGETLEWNVKAEGATHAFRVVLRPTETTRRVAVEVEYQRDDASVVQTQIEVPVEAWSSVEAADGTTLGLWVAKKKHRKISISGGDNPLDGMD
ncbi:MAG: hypothetical protein AAGA54_07650 [Myxococcota bacterium]